ncbi:response regulator transcription factor [Xanthomonas theicola]|nr:response regulator transcription factor [Xanthomonas theicola]QNH25523.1 response regulator transcription factor [Xanthomonas theicola]
MTRRVVVADDHPAVVQGCRFVLGVDGFYDVVATAANGPELLQVLTTVRCDLLIVDYNMPDKEGDGMQLLKLLRRRHPMLPMLLFSALDNVALITQVLELDNIGIMHKSSDIMELPNAANALLFGRRYIDARIQDRLLQADAQRLSNQVELTGREIEVIRLLAQGSSPAEVAQALSRSIKTVSWAKISAKRKLGVASDAQLFQYFRELHGG